MDAPWEHYSKCKQPHRRGRTLYDPTYTRAWSVKSTEQGVTPWLPGSGGGRGGEVQSLVMVAQHCERPKNHSTVHFKMVIILCEFYLNLKGKKWNLEIFPLLLCLTVWGRILASPKACRNGLGRDRTKWNSIFPPFCSVWGLDFQTRERT